MPFPLHLNNSTFTIINLQPQSPPPPPATGVPNVALLLPPPPAGAGGPFPGVPNGVPHFAFIPDAPLAGVHEGFNNAGVHLHAGELLQIAGDNQNGVPNDPPLADIPDAPPAGVHEGFNNAGVHLHAGEVLQMQTAGANPNGVPNDPPPAVIPDAPLPASTKASTTPASTSMRARYCKCKPLGLFRTASRTPPPRAVIPDAHLAGRLIICFQLLNNAGVHRPTVSTTASRTLPLPSSPNAGLDRNLYHGFAEDPCLKPWRQYVPFVHKRTYLITLPISLVLIGSTVAMVIFSNSKSSPCFKIRGKTIFCKEASISLQTVGMIFFLGGFLCLNLASTIKKLKWVKIGNKWVSAIFFVGALFVSNLPSFISEYHYFGFWVSTSYHIYFWMIETVLSLKTNTNLHSTFASINTSIIWSLSDKSEKFTYVNILVPAGVLILGGILHFLTLHFSHHFENLKFPSTKQYPLIPQPQTALQKIPFCVRYFFKNCFWVWSVLVYEIFNFLGCFDHRNGQNNDYFGPPPVPGSILMNSEWM